MPSSFSVKLVIQQSHDEKIHMIDHDELANTYSKQYQREEGRVINLGTFRLCMYAMSFPNKEHIFVENLHEIDP